MSSPSLSSPLLSRFPPSSSLSLTLYSFPYHFLLSAGGMVRSLVRELAPTCLNQRSCVLPLETRCSQMYKYLYLKKILSHSLLHLPLPSFLYPLSSCTFFFLVILRLLFRPRLLPKRMRSHFFPYSIFQPFSFFLSFPNHFPFSEGQC